MEELLPLPAAAPPPQCQQDEAGDRHVPASLAVLLGFSDCSKPESSGASNTLPFSHAGGLAAVIYTDALQTLVMVLGAIVLAVKGKSWGSTDPPLSPPQPGGLRNKYSV